ncbi:phage tail protein [Desulfobulbus elongatus]|uniref:phage tail protein n=1 Tax=Desulfobulbus elongatus TaxID=53332 RepID=UPI0005530C40|nr:phage tail protein [Desulfobulbus elongatus]
MIIDIMMALGTFRFGLSTAAYQQLRRSTAYRWPVQERLGRLPARQFVGPGDDTVEIDGVIYPTFAGGLAQLDHMRALAGTGEPQSLIDSRGWAWGRWCIERVEETRTEFGAGGPLKIEFRVALGRYGED